ncbi:MAG: hypothetical protein RIG77_10050 [Cyclobacteriaceae bacterium]
MKTLRTLAFLLLLVVPFLIKAQEKFAKEINQRIEEQKFIGDTKPFIQCVTSMHTKGVLDDDIWNLCILENYSTLEFNDGGVSFIEENKEISSAILKNLIVDQYQYSEEYAYKISDCVVKYLGIETGYGVQIFNASIFNNQKVIDDFKTRSKVGYEKLRKIAEKEEKRLDRIAAREANREVNYQKGLLIGAAIASAFNSTLIATGNGDVVANPSYYRQSSNSRNRSSTNPTVLHYSDMPIMLNGASIIAQDDENTYLGKISNKYDSESILNKYGRYGDKHSTTSIWNEYGQFGGQHGLYSPFNKYSTSPPIIIKNGKTIGYLTVGLDGISPWTIKGIEDKF